MWCNAWTCDVFGEACKSCDVCSAAHAAELCEGWCNEHTCMNLLCKGCSLCEGSAYVKGNYPGLEAFHAAKAEVVTYTQEQLAAQQWFSTFISALGTNDVPISQGGTLSNCRFLLRNQYSIDATVTVQLPNGGAGGLRGDMLATDMGFPSPLFDGILGLPLSDCVLFGGVKHHDGFTGQSGIIGVEYCPTADGKGIWKGQDVPFRDGNGNSMRVPPSWFEDVGRYMYMKGHLTPEGYLKAEQLTMCLGQPCDESKIPYAEWNCAAPPPQIGRAHV